MPETLTIPQISEKLRDDVLFAAGSDGVCYLFMWDEDGEEIHAWLDGADEPAVASFGDDEDAAAVEILAFLGGTAEPRP